jgi:hypothetical protein
VCEVFYVYVGFHLRCNALTITEPVTQKSAGKTFAEETQPEYRLPSSLLAPFRAETQPQNPTRSAKSTRSIGPSFDPKDRVFCADSHSSRYIVCL